MLDAEKKWENIKKWLYFAVAVTFVWGLLAHGYGFAQSAFSHDSLNEINGADGGNSWKIQLGRFVIPLYRAVFRTNMTLPWLVGMLSLLWLGLAVYLVIRIFHIESKLTAVLVSGIFVTNISVIATAATYLHDFDCDMFALMCSVAAVYCWRMVPRFGIYPGAALTMLALGIYQSYVCVTIVLVMFVCILDLLNEKCFKTVFSDGLKAVGMLILGGILYCVAMKLVLAGTDTSLSSGDYNSLDAALNLTPQSIVYFTVYAYMDCFSRLWNLLSVYPDWFVKSATQLLGLVIGAALVTGLCKKRIGWPEKLLCVVLVGLIPLGMNMMYVLTTGVVHDLMVYAVWLFYLLALLLADWLEKQLPKSMGTHRKVLPLACMLLVFSLIYSNVQVANSVYLKKDLEQDAYLSMMTRIVYRMESVADYEPGTTPVVFVGVPEQQNRYIPGLENFSEMTGAEEPYVADLQTQYRAQRYFAYILSNPAVMADGKVWESVQKDSRVNAMPSYPEEDCMQIIDGTLVVKVGDPS